MLFTDFETVEIDQSGAVTIQWLRHHAEGWHTVIVIDDGQVHPVVWPGRVNDRRFAGATSSGVEYVGTRYSEAQARHIYRTATATEPPGPTLHLVTNNAYDTIVLTAGDIASPVLSEWTATRAEIDDLIESGTEPEDWDVQDPLGLELEGREASVHDFGEPVLSVSAAGWQIHDEDRAAERAEFYGVTWPVEKLEESP